MGLDIRGIINGISDIALSEEGQRFICGTYSNGKTRSVVDAMRDEYISPDDRAAWDKKKAKKKKKKKKKKNDPEYFWKV